PLAHQSRSADHTFRTRGGPMRRLLLAAGLLLAGACEAPRDVAAPARPGPLRLQASVLDPALAAALATAAPATTLEIIVNYDETVRTRAAVTNAMPDLAPCVAQINNVALVAAVA